MARSIIAFLVVLLFPVFALANPVGLWSRTSKNGEVHIRITETRNGLSGTISWMATPKTDRNNPDTSLNKRSLIGVKIFKNLKKIGKNAYEGKLYNPEDGKTYSGKLTVINQNTLKLRGCIIFPLCKSDQWKLVVK